MGRGSLEKLHLPVMGGAQARSWEEQLRVEKDGTAVKGEVLRSLLHAFGMQL